MSEVTEPALLISCNMYNYFAWYEAKQKIDDAGRKTTQNISPINLYGSQKADTVERNNCKWI